jgi:hypothetical protein
MIIISPPSKISLIEQLTVEEFDDFDEEISEETIQIVDYWKLNEV